MKHFLLGFVVLLMLQISDASAQQKPVRILIAYHSETGNTEKIAQAIRDGAKSVQGMEITIQKMADIKDDSISSFDGIVVGTPVHWANVSVESRRFVDRLGAALAKTKVLGEGRTAGVFCTAGNVASGKEMARLSLIAAMLALRFVVIGGVDEEGYGTMGPQATTAAGDPGISNKELEEGRRFGERFARLTRQFRTPR